MSEPEAEAVAAAAEDTGRERPDGHYVQAVPGGHVVVACRSMATVPWGGRCPDCARALAEILAGGLVVIRD